MPRLVIESGKFSGRELDLQKAAIVGRGETADLRIPDGKASREHCRVFQQAGTWVVVDLNSVNGIQVNGVKTTRKNLRDGDTILIGETMIAFRGAAAPAAASVPEAGDIEVDEIDVGGGPVVQPTRPAQPSRPAPPQARKPAASNKAKEAAFAAARADASARRQSARSAPAKGLEVRDNVLQFSRIDARKASIFQTDLSQAGGMAPWIIWAAGIGFVVLIMFLIIKLLGVTAG